MRIGRVIAAVVIAPLLAVALPAAESSADDAREAQLQRALDRLVARDDGPPGVIAVVQRGSERKRFVAGTTDLRQSRRWLFGDTMRIASVAKAFSAATALSLVSDGRLSLDDTIGMRLPTLPAAWASITLSQLLGHTSGLPDFSLEPAFGRALARSLQDPPAPRALVDFVKDKPPEFTPGSQYRYSNTDNIVVGLMVEAATGRAYEGELGRRVFDRVGMPNSALPRGSRIARPVAHGYAIAPPDAPEDVTSAFAAGWTWASGGIVSTASELNRFIRAYAGGRLFGAPERAHQLSFRAGSSEPRGPGGNSAGLGIFRYRTDCGTVYGHTGNTAGYVQFAAASADGQRSVVVSANAQVVPPRLESSFQQLRRAEQLAVCAALADE